jgi:hypothetical protein
MSENHSFIRITPVRNYIRYGEVFVIAANECSHNRYPNSEGTNQVPSNCADRYSCAPPRSTLAAFYHLDMVGHVWMDEEIPRLGAVHLSLES